MSDYNNLPTIKEDQELTNHDLDNWKESHGNEEVNKRYIKAEVAKIHKSGQSKDGTPV